MTRPANACLGLLQRCRVDSAFLGGSSDPAHVVINGSGVARPCLRPQAAALCSDKSKEDMRLPNGSTETSSHRTTMVAYPSGAVRGPFARCGDGTFA